MKINELLKQGENTLIKSNIEEAKLKAKLLLLDILEISKEEYVLIQNKEIKVDRLQKYNNDIELLKQGKPLEYIIGKAYFLDNEYIVNESVLIPRLDTELIVSKALDLIKKNNFKNILEIGTGSGIIGIHLVKNSNVKVLATDISKEALEIAKINAKNLNVDFNRYELIESNVFENIKGEFDLIISNPPYVKTEEMKTLNKDVLQEPILALDGGEDGLRVYKQIIENAFKYINDRKGFLLLEIGARLADDVFKILEDNNWTKNTVFKDFSGLNRIILSEK